MTAAIVAGLLGIIALTIKTPPGGGCAQVA